MIIYYSLSEDDSLCTAEYYTILKNSYKIHSLQKRKRRKQNIIYVNHVTYLQNDIIVK